MNIETIEPHGLCAGVNAAIAKALKLQDVWCLHALVHNEIVTAELAALGFKFVEDIEEVPRGATVVFSAHGVSPAVRERAKERNLKIIDTTCPFVAKVHRAAARFSAKGLPVVIIGDARHIEVKGIAGETKEYYVVRTADDVQRLPLAPHTAIGVVCQTTMNSDEAQLIYDALGRRYEVNAVPTVCHATSERQQAVHDFCTANPGAAVLVLGSATSSNTQRLREIASEHGAAAFVAGNASEVVALRNKLAAFPKVGLTSGASTPERFYEEALRILRNIPKHIAVIMDGNGRWAIARGKKRIEGHRAGAKTLERMLNWCKARGIQYLTVYAFSTENWNRPHDEVEGLMKLLSLYIKNEFARLVKDQVRFRIIGRRSDLPPKLLKEIEELERKTATFQRQLIVALSYGGRAEIVDAVNRARGPVTEETFRNLLYAPDVPDPDLVIRTSGEKRTSNFLLWETAYSEYHFTDVLWPDFSEQDFDAALADYATRDRRHGSHS